MKIYPIEQPKHVYSYLWENIYKNAIPYQMITPFDIINLINCWDYRMYTKEILL